MYIKNNKNINTKLYFVKSIYRYKIYKKFKNKKTANEIIYTLFEMLMNKSKIFFEQYSLKTNGIP